MDALHYLVLLPSIFIIVHQLTVRRRIQGKKLPPSPPSFPIIGHFHLIKMPIHEALNNIYTKYGPIVLLRLGSRPTLVLSTRSAVEELFTKNDIIFSNRPLLPSRKIVEYNFTSLGAPYGNHWRNLRRFFAVEVFSPKRLQMSSDVRTEEIRLTTKHLFKSSFKGAGKVDMKSFFYVLDFNIIMKMVAGDRCFEEEEMGLDTDAAKGKLDELKKRFSPIMPTALGDYFPFLRWITYYGAEKSIIKEHNKRDTHLQALLDAHQNPKISPSVSGGDFSRTIDMVDVMLKLQESEPEFYSNDVIKGNMMAMLLAGTHTSVITMEKTASRLLSHPDVLRKAREEIDNLVGHSRLLNEADLPKLPYLHCVINEALRLDVVKVLPSRESLEECTVGGFHIPRGTQLLVNIWALHRDPEMWQDPNKFMPERFLQSEEQKGGPKFMPFGIGRRQCPGSPLAMRMMALSIGTLIHCYEWEAAEGESQGAAKTPRKRLEEKSCSIIFRPREALTKVLAQL